MRFIVNLLRILIYASCASIIVLLTIFAAFIVDGGIIDTPLGALGNFVIVYVAILTVVGLSSIALFISLHDRHAEIVVQLKQIANALSNFDRTRGTSDVE
ncbi:hypothetical protein [Sphingobium phenoxybenzoativorans]|uniref:hypothetical protein n=1 Tax=Sphingobium phenoxybenzoativorans TaxID=1592790 RepID=UPI0008723161|nr:hypothetical protein [Sphingobium phenoxybenzoativorans]